MVPFKLVVRTAALLLAVALVNCGGSPLQPGGTAGQGGATGNAGAGGNTGMGGTAGGTAGHAGAGGSVSPGTVTLRLTLGPPEAYCDMSCGGAAQHITILTASGQPVPIDVPFCSPMCQAGCQPVGCPVGGACLLVGVGVTGAELTWDGTAYPTSTCGAGASCYKPTVMPPGKYIARMCATPGSLTQPFDAPPVCNATGASECTDVVFDFPSKSVVEGTLGGAKTCGAIHASDYDQSCVVDSDCVAEREGDFCQPGVCKNCPFGAVSVKAQMQYEADLANAIPNLTTCPCTFTGPAACVFGTCGFRSIAGAPPP